MLLNKIQEILRALDTNWEHKLDGDASPSQGKFRIANLPTWMFLGDGMKPENPQETHVNIISTDQEFLDTSLIAVIS